MTSVVPGRPLVRAVAVAAAIACATFATASGRTADVSANWSGYVVTGRAFTGVSGTWTVAAADCLSKASPSTAAAFWVGLGGSVPASKKIEQIGTDSDCNPDGTESYYAWYELWPKQAVLLSLDIEAGDRVRASVRLHGDTVQLVLVDLTSGRRFDSRLGFARPDTSSAEWIGEAPAIAVKTGTPFLPLTRFDRVTFSHSTATAGSHTAPIGDAAWNAQRVRLDSLRGVGRGTADRFLGRLNRARVVPSPLDAAGGGFSLRWASGTA
jgi:Peptidase A4 family